MPVGKLQLFIPRPHLTHYVADGNKVQTCTAAQKTNCQVQCTSQAGV